eukprot:COSAG05_NODE_2262_length_3318_cov_4.455421_1_plen_57_part_10
MGQAAAGRQQYYSYWGLIDFRMDTPRLGIQVIDLGRSKPTWRAQMQWAPPPLHLRAP